MGELFSTCSRPPEIVAAMPRINPSGLTVDENVPSTYPVGATWRSSMVISVALISRTFSNQMARCNELFLETFRVARRDADTDEQFPKKNPYPGDCSALALEMSTRFT